MRFLLDDDVPAEVAGRLRAAGHECWAASEIGLGTEPDDALTVHAARHHAVVVSRDPAFARRRRRNPAGRHVQLRCPPEHAAEVLLAHLPLVAAMPEGTVLSLAPGNEGVT